MSRGETADQLCDREESERFWLKLRNTAVKPINPHHGFLESRSLIRVRISLLQDLVAIIVNFMKNFQAKDSIKINSFIHYFKR